jgi:thioesterase domain-containing protein
VTIIDLGRRDTDGEPGQATAPPTEQTLEPDNLTHPALQVTTVLAGGRLRVSLTADPARIDPADLPAVCSTLLSELRDSTTVRPLTVAAEPGARRVFLVHPVDGDVERYGRLATTLGPRFACYGLSADPILPGPHVPDVMNAVSTADSAGAALAAMAARYLHRIRAMQPHGPYVVAGQDFGAAPGFVMAQQLEAAGQHVRLVLLQPPPIPAGDPGIDSTAIDSTALSVTLIDALRDVMPATTLRGINHAVTHAVTRPAGQRADVLAGLIARDNPLIAHTVRLLLHHYDILAHWRPTGTVENLHLVYPSEADMPDDAGGWHGFGRIVRTTSLGIDAHLVLHDPAALARVAGILTGPLTLGDDPGGAERG